MYYFEYPTTDTTIYEGDVTSSINTGLDQIIEVENMLILQELSVNVSRILMKFDYNYISQSIQSGIIPSIIKYYLNLYDVASSEELGSRTNIIYLYH